jgi:hypothetical protein
MSVSTFVDGERRLPTAREAENEAERARDGLKAVIGDARKGIDRV